METGNKLGDKWGSPAENWERELEQWQWGYEKEAVGGGGIKLGFH